MPIASAWQQVVQGSTLGILLNFGARNPPHRQAEKRYASANETPYKK